MTSTRQVFYDLAFEKLLTHVFSRNLDEREEDLKLLRSQMKKFKSPAPISGMVTSTFLIHSNSIIQIKGVLVMCGN